MHDPRNPYESFIVSASAGSGKTWQLAKRFLMLVGSGAAPDSILTITFTKKAAAEMRERIVADAMELTQSSEAATEFNQQLRAFAADHGPVPPVRSAIETGQLIVKSAQTLQISTIDALFTRWMHRFALDQEDGLPGERLATPVELEELSRDVRSAMSLWAFRNLLSTEEYRQIRGDQSFQKLLTRALELNPMESWIHLASAMDPEGNPLHTRQSTSPTDDEDFRSFFNDLKEPVEQLCSLLSNKTKREAILQALADESHDGLYEGGLFNKSHVVSGTLLRGKKRDEVHTAIQTIDSLNLNLVNKMRRALLYKQGSFQLHLWTVSRSLRKHYKTRKNLFEFKDLLLGVFALMSGPPGDTIRYQITRQVRHVMLDEFQDTSMMQWEVFKPLLVDLLTDSSLDDRPTVFIVGDQKQSIYGFREADPLVMDAASRILGPYCHEVPLTASYRSANQILSFVDEVCNPHFEEDLSHQTASANGLDMVANVSRLDLLPSSEEESPDERSTDILNNDLSDLELEAKRIVHYIQYVLQQKYPVYDKDSCAYRAIQPGDIGVLYRTAKIGSVIETMLADQNLPVIREDMSGFFRKDEIVEMCAVLRWCSQPDNLFCLLQVLAGPLGDYCRDAALEILSNSDVSDRRVSTILRALSADGMDIGTRLLKLRQSVRSRSASEVIVEINSILHGREKLVQTYGETPGDRLRICATLDQFTSLVDEFESQGTQGLCQLNAWLEARSGMDDLGINHTGNMSGSVNLMTIHKSKGLEWPLVILADMQRPFSQSDRYWVRILDNGQPAVYYKGTKDQSPPSCQFHDSFLMEDELDRKRESARLLYVAMTRARQYLAISSHDLTRPVGDKETAYYNGIAEVFDNRKDHVQEQVVHGLGTLRSQWTPLFRSQELTEISPQAPSVHTTKEPDRWKKDPFAKVPDVEILLSSQLDRPEKKQERLKSTMAPETAALFGTLVHGGLESLAKGNDPVACIRHLLETESNGLDAATNLADLALAEAIATWKSSTLQSVLAGKTVMTEVSFASISTGHSSDEGTASCNLTKSTMDLIALGPDECVVVDYKTNRFIEGLGLTVTREMLKTFARDHYAAQMESYRSTLAQSLNRSVTEIKGYLLFTHYDTLVEFSGEQTSRREFIRSSESMLKEIEV